jgi:C4-dicarboxylate-specific signal transduction histidine kinase
MLDRDSLDLQKLHVNLQHINQESLQIAEIFKQLNNNKKHIDCNIPKVVDITDVAKNVFTLVRSKIENNHICLKFKLYENLPRVLGIKSQLELVVLNLFNNAIESIHDAGNSSGTICFEAWQDQNMVHIIVRDSGPGVDAKSASKLFQSLHTSKEYGLGVGLLVSRRLIENHGGRLWVESSSTEGIFHFVLPYVPRHQ